MYRTTEFFCIRCLSIFDSWNCVVQQLFCGASIGWFHWKLRISLKASFGWDNTVLFCCCRHDDKQCAIDKTRRMEVKYFHFQPNPLICNFYLKRKVKVESKLLTLALVNALSGLTGFVIPQKKKGKCWWIIEPFLTIVFFFLWEFCPWGETSCIALIAQHYWMCLLSISTCH